MLTFLMGVDMRAKRDHIGSRLFETVQAGEKAVLIVPEQENFEREKELMLRYGERASNAMCISSFSRFCRSLLEAHGQSVKPRADDAAVNVLMSLAVKQVSDELEIYGGHCRRPGRVRELVSFYDLVSGAGRTPEELLKAGQGTDGSLPQKTRELSLIFTAFEGLLSKRFSTETDNINVASRLLGETDEYLDTDFWFDDYRGFTGAQLKFIAALLPRCRNVYVSLTGCTAASGGVSFRHTQKNFDRLTAAANAANVKVNVEPVASGEKAPGLMHLRDNLFVPVPVSMGGEPEGICCMRASNRYEECEMIALRARQLLDGGVCRARDMAVLHRDEGLNAPLIAALKKYGVPVFEDARRSLFSFPLVRLMLSATEIAAKGFSTDTVLAALKTNMTGVSVEDAAALQNYAFCWQIDGRAWETDFTANPRGLGEEFDDEDRETLRLLNEVRAKFVSPLQKLRRALWEEDAAGSCRALYLYLKEIDAASHFQAYAEYLCAHGEEARAVECAGVWDACMDSLDALQGAVGENRIAPAYFYELLTLILSGGSIGYIPPGVDKMTVGNVDRARVLNAKAVFIPGFTEGTFPRRTAVGGLLSSKEMRALSDLDFGLDKLPEEIYEEERLILYNTLNLPTDFLFLSWPASLTTGEKTEPSPVLEELKNIFPDLRFTDAAEVPPEERILTAGSAFDQYASVLREQDTLASTLASVLREDPAYAAEERALRRALDGNQPRFDDPAEAVRLFGKNIGMSASRAETYAKCPFKYFCRYGMRVEKLSVSRIDARINGLIIHKVFQDVMDAHIEEGLHGVTDEQFRAEVEASVNAYCESNLGGLENLPASMLRTLERLKKEVVEMLRLRREEFDECLFRYKANELGIGIENGIDGYVVPLPDGGSLTIYGSVDRVDLMEDGGERYVRVVDYKTGGKEFQLSDVFYGLNMQMLIYLYAVCRNGVERFGEMLPAGVLYLPAKTAGKPLDRYATQEDYKRRLLENGRMNGIILQDIKVVCGMEKAARGLYINAYVKPDGTLAGNFLTLEEFGLLHQKVDEMLRDTGMALHEGVIPALPVDEGGHTACDYCDYAPVCLRERTAPVRKVESAKHTDALKRLHEEAEA